MTKAKQEGTPLTAYARKRLAESLIAVAKAKLTERFEKESDILAKEALAEAFGKDYFSQFSALPQGWLPTGNDFYLVDKNAPIDSGSSYSTGVQLSMAIPLPASVNHGRVLVSKKLYSKVVAMKDAREEAQRDFAEFTGTVYYGGARKGSSPGQVKVALAAIRTVEELQREWPEAYALLPPEDGGLESGPRYPLPALPLADTLKLFKKLTTG